MSTSKIEKICSGECCGCSACYAVCPKSAVSMQENEKGFLHPVVSDDCIRCGLCARVCNTEDTFHTVMNAYIGNLKEKDKLSQSQSGGAFSAAAEAILQRNGVLYGAAMDEHLEAVHIRADSRKTLARIKGSKYIQSRMEHIFLSVEQDLNEQRTVLFSGTPCQVSGLYKFLKHKKTDLSNLYTADLICHGVPSVLVWRDLLKYYEKKHSSRITQAVFRSKSAGGWDSNIGVYTFENGQTISTPDYAKLFGSLLSLRNSCYQCRYARKERIGDITIGDAWGIRQKNPECYDKNGVSLLLLNTPKAQALFPEISGFMSLKEVNYQDYLQGSLKHPAKPNRNAEEFWNDYRNRNFSYVFQKYAKNHILLNWKYVLKKLLRKIHAK